MNRWIKALLIILIPIIIIFQSSCAPKKISRPDKYQYPYYTIDVMSTVYEFHPEYIKITDFVELSTFGEKMRLTEYKIAHPVAFWDQKDVYDVKLSANIKSFDSKLNNRWKKIEKYKDYDYINYKVYFKNLLKGNKKYSFWISYKTKRLPHLHTKELIADNKNINFGMRTGYSQISPEEYMVFAIPADSKDLRLFNYSHSKEEEVNGWKLYIYDLSMCMANNSASFRMGFYMGNEKAGPDIEDIVEKCKEIKGNYQ